MGDTPTVSRLLRGTPEDPAQPSWGGRYVRAWARPFATFERLTTAADRIEHFAILELVLPLGDGAPTASRGVGWWSRTSRSSATSTTARRMRFRFSPKEAKTYTYTIRSNVPSLEGRTGAITAVDPPPDAAAQPARRPAALVDRRSGAGGGRGRAPRRRHRQPVAAGLPRRLRRAPGARPDAGRDADASACRARQTRAATAVRRRHAAAWAISSKDRRRVGEVVDVGHDDQLVGAASARPARRGRARTVSTLPTTLHASICGARNFSCGSQ